MSNRAGDWLSQASHDLEHARHSSDSSDYDWACFAAHQAAEKAVKAFFLYLGGEGWGHAITRLLKDLEQKIKMPPQLLQAARRLDKHYIPTRYPNGFDSGSPYDYYTREEANQAVQDAEGIYEFCQQSIR
jgi:HEPN domain-containing protein